LPNTVRAMSSTPIVCGCAMNCFAGDCHRRILELKRFPTDLNRWDSQEITDGGVFGH